MMADIQRAIFRGRSEVRAAMQRERTSNDAALTAMRSNQLQGLDEADELDESAHAGNLTLQVPIESDADAGFASRTRRIKTHRTLPAAAEAFGNGPAEGSRMAAAAAFRRRRVLVPKRRRPSEVIFDPPLPIDSAQGAPDDYEEEEEGIVVGTRQRSAPPSTGRGPYASIGDTFRNVRASASSFSPFRSSRLGVPISSGSQTQTGQNVPGLPGQSQSHPHPQQRRSGSSISRWFGTAGGGGYDSSESEDERMMSLDNDEEDVASPEMGSSGLGLRSESESGEGDGEVVPIPGGERVGRAEIALSGEGTRGEYSPPSQDRL